MLLIIITAAVVAVGIVLIVLEIVKYWDCGVAGVTIVVIASIILVIEIVIALIQNAGIPGQIASNEQRYESLVYQLENDLYDNDNDLGKKELYNQIQDWNEDLATGKAMQHDIWIGVYWPDIYDHFDFIELEVYNHET